MTNIGAVNGPFRKQFLIFYVMNIETDKLYLTVPHKAQQGGLSYQHIQV